MLNLDFLTFSSSTQELLQLPVLFLPKIIFAVLIIVVGWFIGWIIERLIVSIFRALPFFDEALRSIGVEELLKRGGLRVNLGGFFGVILKVFVIFIFLVAALDVLGLQSVNVFIVDSILSFIPRVVSASAIVVIGFVVASFVFKLVAGTSKAAQVEGGLAAKISKWSVIILSVFVAVNELGVATEIINSIILGVVAAISLALGLAFGLGGQQAAADFLSKVKNDIEK